MPSASTIGANAGTAPPVAEAKTGELARRVVSAAVLLPLALAAVWGGGVYFAALILFFALVMAWEWARLCGRGRFGAAGPVLMAVLAGVVTAAALGRAEAAVAVAGAGAAAVYAAARLASAPNAGWTGLGAVYIGLPALALVWLRADAAGGLALVLWLFGVVWVSDIAAYLVGRTMGGPQFAPAISPHKTWSGFVGGLAAAAVLSLIVAAATGEGLWGLAALGVALSAVAQCGDLLESGIKRRFGVKDVSHIIPGHGGVFDRVDGVLTAAPAAALLVWLGDGAIAPWR